jgi:DNA helicase IV
VLGWLRDPEFLARVGEGVVTAEEQRLLVESWQGADLSVEDIPLVDELRYALGDVPDRAREEDHELDDFLGGDLQELTTAAEREFGTTAAWTPPSHRIDDDGYAHVLVDEAQDLTPMQWRMVGRRGRAATWTIVGDAAQSSWPVPGESASARATAIAGKDLHEFHLSTNYRNSAEIYEYAAAYAEGVGLDADLPTAVRATGVSPRDVPAGVDLAETVRHELAEIAGQVGGTIGIVAPVGRRDEVASWLASWAEFADAAPHATSPASAADDRIVVLTGIDTKGLEFDGIVVVDPDAIEAESPTGRATLYVILTRATQLLTLIR